jgi:copper homeostasis protein
MSFSLEICAYSSHSVSIAAHADAHRVELCSGRLEGGTTPSLGLIQEALQFTGLGVFPIVRPRGGDFCYSTSEFNEMLRDVEMCRNMGVQGIVTGILHPDGSFDINRLQQLKDAAGPLTFCIHRAIDMSVNPLEAVDALIDLGVTRILSSGARNTALEGIEMLDRMLDRANGRIEIMAGSGVNVHQIETLWKVGIRHFHASASSNFPSPMQFRNPQITMGKDGDQDEYLRAEADLQKVQSMMEKLVELSNSDLRKA